MDWPSWWLLNCSLLIWGMVNLERHTYKRDDVVKNLNPRRIRNCTPYNRQVLPKRRKPTSLPLKMTCKSMKIQQGYENTQLGLLIDPKCDSLVSKVGQTTTMMDRSSTNKRSYTQCHLEEDLMLWCENRHPSIGNEGRSYIWYKRWPSAKSYPRCAPSEPKNLDYPQKYLLRVVAHLVSQTHFLSSLSKSRDEISFKGVPNPFYF
jgi:hypothetical protein